MTQSPEPRQDNRSLCRPLFDGPVDIIGDVHGEFAALRSLLGHLGYDAEGQHPDGRRLVFVGDLTDRGPDSPSVFHLVRRLIAEGRAAAVMGNHEFNLLRGFSLTLNDRETGELRDGRPPNRKKDGNDWFFEEEQHHKGGLLLPQAFADEALRQEIFTFLKTLPLALERDDLRVVHACWSDDRVAQLRAEHDALATYGRYERAAKALAKSKGLDEIDQGLLEQNHNPIKVATSGVERRTDSPFPAGGKMRNEERVAWWDAYDAPQSVVFGHYWRSPHLGGQGKPGIPNLFDGRTPFEALGPRRNAFCIDYSVGRRALLRASGGELDTVALAALRFPEKVLVLDDGRTLSVD